MRKTTLIFIAAAMTLLMGGCKNEQGTQMSEPPAVPVIAATPMVKDITSFLESIGTLEPFLLIEIRPEIDGTVMEVKAKEGQWVEKGAPLFKVNAHPYAIKVHEAEAQLAMGEANLHSAQKKLARVRPLAQKDLVSQTEWDDLETDAEKAQAAVALDEARLKSAMLDLEHCTIASPAAGRVGKLDTHPGHLVARGQPEAIATIAQMDPLLVEFTLTEKEFLKLPKENLPFEVKPLCSSDHCKSGLVHFLDNHFDPATGLILARGTLQNSDHSLRPGQSVLVRVPVAVNSSAKLIPQKAIRYNQEGPYIYVIQPDQTVALRQLVLGEEQGSDQIVLEGIEPSEQLVIDGHLRLSPGIKVEVKR